MASKERIKKQITTWSMLQESTREWLNVVIDRLDQSGRLDEVDGGSLFILATEFDKIVTISDDVVNKRVAMVDDKGKRSGIMAELHTAEQIVLSFIKEYGLTPKARKVLTERVDGRTNVTNNVLEEFGGDIRKSFGSSAADWEVAN